VTTKPSRPVEDARTHDAGAVRRDPCDSEENELRARRTALKVEPPVDLPLLATVDETAALLRTTRKAIYSMVERGQLPGVTRIGRRVLIRTPELLDWLCQKSAPSPKECRR
jgi:excisionase family DNA binding protein